MHRARGPLYLTMQDSVGFMRQADLLTRIGARRAGACLCLRPGPPGDVMRVPVLALAWRRMAYRRAVAEYPACR